MSNTKKDAVRFYFKLNKRGLELLEQASRDSAKALEAMLKAYESLMELKTGNMELVSSEDKRWEERKGRQEKRKEN